MRKDVYLQARGLVRRIAFCNPLLDIDKLLFVKRHDAGGVFHMCDQYYGCNAVPGGGLFVLARSVRRRTRRLVNLLAELGGRERAAGGPEARRRLVPLARGLLRRPARSSSPTARPRPATSTQGKEAYHWTPGVSATTSSRCNADGTGLVQLTDGPCGRFRSVLPARRPDRVRLRAPRRLPALRPALPGLHAVLAWTPTAATSSA